MITMGYRFLKLVGFVDIFSWDVKRYNANNLTYSSKYPVVPFGKVLKERKMEWVNIDDASEYSILGVRTYGKGVFINRTSRGKDLKMRKYQKSQSNYLYWCKVDTKNGAFGVITDEYENTFGSSNMSYLKIDTSKIDVAYLQLLFQYVPFNKYMDNLVVGVTNRKYITKEVLLNDVKIPLPDLDIQHRIVDRYRNSITKAEQNENFANELEESIDKVLFEELGIGEVKNNTIKNGILQFVRFFEMIKWGVNSNSAPLSPKTMFLSSTYHNIQLVSIAQINPKISFPNDKESFSFIPMECISDVYG